MDKIGIIGALEQELEILKSSLTSVSVIKRAGTEYVTGELLNKKVTLAKCGVGKVNAAVCAQILADFYHPDCVINTGAAGAIADYLNIGDVVISTDLVMHDFDVTPVFPDYKTPVKYTYADERLVAIAAEAARELTQGGVTIHAGRIATGDRFICESEIKKALWTEYRALCVEMEGAAVAQACYMNKIPFVIVRAVSDKADEGAKVSFENFMAEASKNSSRIILGMIKRL